ncbi:MAG: hypothetical protein ACXWKP_35315 [Bradyrhizobium sp.]
MADALGKPKEPGLHVRRKGSDFSGDSIVQDFNSPNHIHLYLNFEIYEEADQPIFLRASSAMSAWYGQV